MNMRWIDVSVERNYIHLPCGALVKTCIQMSNVVNTRETVWCCSVHVISTIDSFYSRELAEFYYRETSSIRNLNHGGAGEDLDEEN